MQGIPFCGKYTAAEPQFSFGFRGRMDERYDLVRSVRDKQFMYVRNFMPHRPHGQHNAYMFQTPTTRVWYQLFEQGKLNAVQSQFWQPKSVEELYDLKSDPDEVNDLARSGSKQIQAQLARMRTALDEWENRIKDVGFLPELEIHMRSKGSSPYEVGHDPAKYDFDSVYAAAKLASSMRQQDLPAITHLLASRNSAVRYWGAVGLLSQGKAGAQAGHSELRAALKDESPIVRINAAEALGRFGDSTGQSATLKVLIAEAEPSANPYVRMAAWNAIDYLDDRARPALEAIRRLPAEKFSSERLGNYLPDLKRKTLADLQERSGK
jgi:uncharacterized sulfatase